MKLNCRLVVVLALIALSSSNILASTVGTDFKVEYQVAVTDQELLNAVDRIIALEQAKKDHKLLQDIAERDYINKYSGNIEKEISIFLNDSPISVSVNPVMENGTVLVPMRNIFEALGFNITWDSKTNSIQASTEKTTINLTVGSSRATVNTTEKILSSVPQNINGSIMVPLRFISEAAGYAVKWDSTNKKIFITTQTNTYEDAVEYFENK
ncbi:MAG: hypothetical protein K0S30_192 [Clostridia bacterium]|nr:hypothetical protein [Clostridia bacterium]